MLQARKERQAALPGPSCRLRGYVTRTALSWSRPWTKALRALTYYRNRADSCQARPYPVRLARCLDLKTRRPCLPCQARRIRTHQPGPRRLLLLLPLILQMARRFVVPNFGPVRAKLTFFGGATKPFDTSTTRPPPEESECGSVHQEEDEKTSVIGNGVALGSILVCDGLSREGHDSLLALHGVGKGSIVEPCVDGTARWRRLGPVLSANLQWGQRYQSDLFSPFPLHL